MKTQSFKSGITPPYNPFDAAFSKSVPDMPIDHQGVEMKAAADRPALPMINTAASDQVAKLGMMLPAPAAAGPAPAFMQPAQPLGAKAPPDVLSFLPKSAPAFNPLRGMDSRPLSERGPVKVGGGGSSRLGQRTLEKAARRGDVEAAKFLTLRDGGRGQSMPPVMNFLPQSKATTAPPVLDFLPQSKATPQAGRDDAFWASQVQAGQTFQSDQEKANVVRVEEENKARSEEANKGFSLQPLDPRDPSRGDAIIRGDGSLFNILPGQKPEVPNVLAFQKLPGTSDAMLTNGGKPVDGVGLYTEQPGWSVKGVNQFMPKPKAPPAPQMVLDYAFDSDGNSKLQSKSIRGPVGTLPTPPPSPAPTNKSRFMDLLSNR